MIKAEFTKSDKGIRLTINGHAGYSKGREDDIVCSAVSGIFYALYGYLSNITKEGVSINCIESGCADIECGYNGEEAMKLACIGIWQLSLTYPAHVSVENSVWNWIFKTQTA